MSKLAEKLAARIKELVGLEVVPKIERTRAGRHQRSEGTWSWYMVSVDGFCVGSQWTATECLRAPKLEHYTYDWGDVVLHPSWADE